MHYNRACYRRTDIRPSLRACTRNCHTALKVFHRPADVKRCSLQSAYTTSFSSFHSSFVTRDRAFIMATYFETVKKSYADVPITEKGVDVSSFLEATEGLIKLFDLLGNSAFVIVQNDMKGNVKKIQDRFLTNPVQNETLQSLVKGESAEKKRTATEGLMWLLRGLDFTSQALRRSVSNKDEELATSFSKAYESSLKQYHNFVVKGAFALAMKACPYRADFYAKLGSPPEKVDEELHKWLDALESIVKQMQEFYTQGNYAKGL